jgi:ACR3 family arsenite efflux pump ArsB
VAVAGTAVGATGVAVADWTGAVGGAAGVAVVAGLPHAALKISNAINVSINMDFGLFVMMFSPLV